MADDGTNYYPYLVRVVLRNQLRKLWERYLEQQKRIENILWQKGEELKEG